MVGLKLIHVKGAPSGFGSRRPDPTTVDQDGVHFRRWGKRYRYRSLEC